MNERLYEIAEELKKLYAAKADAEASEWLARQNIDLIMTEITPEGGWAGKNEAERKTARDQAELNNPGCQLSNDAIIKNHVEALKLNAAIDGLKAEKWAIEWNIRLQLAEANIRAYELPY